MEVLTAVLAFAGAALGAALGYRASIGATRVEREARRREEWGRRFTAALEAATSVDARARAAGRSLLVELIGSAVATDEDRREAAAVLEATAVDVHDARLRLVPPDQLNDVDVVEHTGGEAENGDEP